LFGKTREETAAMAMKVMQEKSKKCKTLICKVKLLPISGTFKGSNFYFFWQPNIFSARALLRKHSESN